MANLLGRLSVFDMFRVGIGPSSSHTVGPMRAALSFAESLVASDDIERTQSIEVELYGSLGATGRGHGTDRAVLLGLSGHHPETVPGSIVESIVAAVKAEGSLLLLGRWPVRLAPNAIQFRPDVSLAFHPNAMRCRAVDGAGATVSEAVHYSVGGGFVVAHAALTATPEPRPLADAVWLPEAPGSCGFSSSADLLAQCEREGASVSDIMLAGELTARSAPEIRERILDIWAAMSRCIDDGCSSEGVLPGGLGVPRRAPALFRTLTAEADEDDPLRGMDWVNLYALAVNEENASGHRVVTAPTNGAAGIVPAVLKYFREFVPDADDDATVRFLLAAAAIGTLIKRNASIAGAEVGCQGEIGSACAMAAAGFAEVLGGSPLQVENAAEIAMEHNLGLTCDPVGGLVQIPCIERNAIGAVKAINAARIALRGDGRHVVSLDAVIRTMRDTGRDMHSKYKETSRGGLAVNLIEC